MANERFVVKQSEVNDLYLIGYNAGSPENSTWGNLENAIEFDTIEDAEEIAASIGNGPIGIPRPK